MRQPGNVKETPPDNLVCGVKLAYDDTLVIGEYLFLVTPGLSRPLLVQSLRDGTALLCVHVYCCDDALSATLATAEGKFLEWPAATGNLHYAVQMTDKAALEFLQSNVPNLEWRHGKWIATNSEGGTVTATTIPKLAFMVQKDMKVFGL